MRVHTEFTCTVLFFRCMIGPVIRTLVLLVCVLLVLSGCGGSGSSAGTSTNGSAAPTVDIDWAQRSRNVTSVPSALSATISVQAVPASGATARSTVNRLAVTHTYEQTYALNAPVRPGPVQLTVQFYAQANGAGDIVGTATTSAILDAQGGLTNSAGTALGPIATVGTIACAFR